GVILSSNLTDRQPRLADKDTRPMPTENDLYDKIGRVTALLVKSTSPDERLRLNAELVSLSEKLSRGTRRRAEFDCSGEGDPAGSGAFSFRSLLERPARNDQEREAAAFIDHSAILG